ncbi:hypothetical protein GCM10028778_13390 [Barrientosiimonas marina]|uniref:Diguanylate cyclase domain-containing protein n=1 Tax=Lentibacillus kimchii TaxID=1542911 RepID=A0ABW2UUQ6_9BACI
MQSSDASLFQRVLAKGIGEIVFVITVDEQGRFYYDFLNQAAKEWTGLTADVIGQTIHDVYPVTIADHLVQQYRKVLETEDIVTYEDHYESTAGTKYSETTLTPLFTDGRCSHIAALVRDVSDQKANERKLRRSLDKLTENKQKFRESENRLRIITDNTNDLITMIDHDGYITYVSPSYEKILEHDAEEYIGKHFLHNIHPDDTKPLVESFRHSVETHIVWQDQFRQRNRSGEYIWSELRGTPVYDANNAFTHMVVVTRNITIWKDYELKLQYMAYHDPLTGLPNRRYFMEQLSWQLEDMAGRTDCLAIMMMDLDQFKTINDQLGHHIGDQTIQEFAERVNKNVRGNDLLARHGGDEFMLLLPGIEGTCDVLKVVDRIQQAVNQAWCIGQHEFTTTSSLGIVISSSSTPESSRTLLEEADNQLYKAKQSGKNGYQIYDFKCDDQS